VAPHTHRTSEMVITNNRGKGVLVCRR
jgi:hypothetical protein